MIAWLNFVALLVSSFLFTLYYARSVGPAELEKRIGPDAYQKCATYRTISSVFMFVAMGNYIAYYWQTAFWIPGV